MAADLDITSVLEALASRVRSPWYTAREAAEYLRYDHPSVMYGGTLARLGKRRGGTGEMLWHRDDLDRWVNGLVPSEVHEREEHGELGAGRGRNQAALGNGPVQDSHDGQRPVHRQDAPPSGDAGARATIEDARAKVTELKADITEQRYQPQRKAVAVEDYAELWLKRKTEGPKPLKPSTADTYAYALETFCDFCGAVDITSITRVDVIGYRDWLQRLRKPNGKKYATNSLGAWWRPVVTMLRDAVADDLLHKDPTYRVDGPATKVKTGRELRTLSGAELWALIDAMRRVCPDRAAETAVLCYTGMRSGELWALTWGDVDWAGPRLHIRQSVSLDVVMDGTKTVDDRDTYMPDVVGFALAEWYQQRQKDGHDVSDDALVFPSARDDSKPRQRGSLKKALKLARVEAKIEQHVNTRVLRRSYNTLMRSLGVDWIVLQSMMGHSSDEMTSRYSGVRLEEKRGAVLKLIQGGAA